MTTETIKEEAVQLSTMIPFVAKCYGVDTKDVLSRNRKKPFITARQIISYFLIRKEGYAYPTVAALMGTYDHSAVRHSVIAAEARMETEPGFNKWVKELEALCYGKQN
jgi:chromosomal replication initiation ATPase DnaA